MKKIPWIPLRLMALSIFVVLAVFASPARGDVYRILEDPQEAAQARVDLIQQAKVEVDALYFLARNDRITQTALSLLRDASRRGIRVRLIVDARFNHLPGSMLVYLRDEGVAVRVYHPFSFRHLPWIFRRMHDKVVVADDKRYVAGGRNLDEAYFGLNPKRNYIDRDVYIEGPSAADADLHFDQLWASRHVADIHAIVSQSEKDQAARLLDAARSSLAARGFVRFDTGTDWSAGRPRQIPVRFLHDPIDAGKGPRVAESLTAVFDTAKQSIVIETPYLIPSRLFINLIARKLQEGVSIRIITNSMKSTDGLLPQVAYLRYRRNLVRWGVSYSRTSTCTSAMPGRSPGAGTRLETSTIRGRPWG